MVQISACIKFCAQEKKFLACIIILACLFELQGQVSIDIRGIQFCIFLERTSGESLVFIKTK